MRCLIRKSKILIGKKYSCTKKQLHWLHFSATSTKLDKGSSDLHQAKRRIGLQDVLQMPEIHFLLHSIYSVTDLQRHFLRVLSCSFFSCTSHVIYSPHYTGQQHCCHRGSLHLTAREESLAAPIPRDCRMHSFDFVALRQAGMKVMYTISKPCWVPPAVCLPLPLKSPKAVKTEQVITSPPLQVNLLDKEPRDVPTNSGAHTPIAVGCGCSLRTCSRTADAKSGITSSPVIKYEGWADTRANRHLVN